MWSYCSSLPRRRLLDLARCQSIQKREGNHRWVGAQRAIMIKWSMTEMENNFCTQTKCDSELHRVSQCQAYTTSWNPAWHLDAVECFCSMKRLLLRKVRAAQVQAYRSRHRTSPWWEEIVKHCSEKIFGHHHFVRGQGPITRRASNLGSVTQKKNWKASLATVAFEFEWTRKTVKTQLQDSRERRVAYPDDWNDAMLKSLMVQRQTWNCGLWLKLKI